MKKCIRCGKNMIEDLSVKNSNFIFDKSKNINEKIFVSVCTKCGYVEYYIKNPEKLDYLINKDKNNIVC